jgi:hypothetical protein
MKDLIYFSSVTVPSRKSVGKRIYAKIFNERARTSICSGIYNDVNSEVYKSTSFVAELNILINQKINEKY